MGAPTRRYSNEEFARRGDAAYENIVRPHLKVEDNGKFAAIDIESGEFEINAEEIVACDKLHARVPEAHIWMVRIGSRYVHRFARRKGPESPQWRLKVLRTFSLPVMLVVLSASERPLYSGDGAGQKSGEQAVRKAETATLKTYRGIVNGLAYSPSGKLLATAGEDGTVRLWNVATGMELQRCSGHKGPVTAVSYHPAGDFLVSGGEDGFLIMWNAETGKEWRRVTNSGRVRDLKFSNDKMNPYYASCGARVSIRLGPYGALWHRFQKETPATIASVAYRGKGHSYLASGAENGTILFWSLAEGADGSTIPSVVCGFGGHRGSVSTLIFSPDAKHLAAAGTTQLTIWDVDEEAPIAHWKVDAQSNIVFSKDGKFLIGGTDAGTEIWEFPSGRRSRLLSIAANALALSPGDNTLAIASGTGGVALVDFDTGKVVTPNGQQ